MVKTKSNKQKQKQGNTHTHTEETKTEPNNTKSKRASRQMKEPNYEIKQLKRKLIKTQKQKTKPKQSAN